MPVTRDLPARIRTCTTNLYGSHLGVFDAKPPTRPWVKDSRFWRYSVCEPTKLTPIQTVPLDAPLQGLVPNLLHFFPKDRETATIPRNGSGISDTSRVLKVSNGTVISAIAKQEDQLISVNPNIRQLLAEEDGMAARILPACEEAELDELWSFVGNKFNQRWLWYAVDHKTNTVLAYVFGRRKDKVFRKLK